MIGDPERRGVVVALGLGVIGVDARVLDAARGRRGDERRVHDRVIDVLRIALVYVGVALLRRGRVDEVGEIGIDEIDTVTRHDRFVVGRRRAEDDVDHVGIAVVDVERVEVADDDDVLERIGRLARLHEVREELCLCQSFPADAVAFGG